MSLGQMNKFIDIIRTEKIKDNEGFTEEIDVVIFSTRAYREGRHGSLKWVNLSSFSDCTDLFRFRVMPGVEVTTDCFILCGNSKFKIISVEDVNGKGMYIEVLAKEINSSG